MSVSSIGHEPYVGARFLRARLIQNLTLAAWIGTHVYRDVAPMGLTKYLLLTTVNAEDRYAIGNIRILNDELWQVEAWCKTNDDAVLAMYAAEIDAELHDATGVMTGPDYGSGVIWSTQRERSLALPAEFIDGVIWRRAGGEYRLQVKAA